MTTRFYHNRDKVYDTDLNDWNARIDANAAAIAGMAPSVATLGRWAALPSGKLKGGNIVPKPDTGPSGSTRVINGAIALLDRDLHQPGRRQTY